MTASGVALWVRWSARDLRARIVQVGAVAAIVALGTGVYAGLSSTSAWRRASYDASFASLQVHDVRVALAQDTYADAASLRNALRGVDEVAQVTTRLVVPIQVDASRAGRTILVPGRLVGVDTSTTNGIDDIVARRGRGLSAADTTTDRVVIDEHFAEHYHLPPQGTIRISGAKQVRYVGQVLEPEYFLVIGNEGTTNAQANFAVVFAAQDAVARLTTRPDQVNEAIVTLRPGADRRATARAIDDVLRTRLPGTAANVTALDDERWYRIMYDDIRGDQRLYSIFAFLVLGGAAFAAFNLVGRIVEAQRREIGIGMSLGLPRHRIAIRPLLVGFEVAMLGALLGIAVGLGVQALMLSVMRRFFPLPNWMTPFEYSTYARGWLIGLALPFVATLLPVMRAVRVEPIEAIRTGPRATKRSAFASLFGRFTVGNSLRQMPFRNVVRAPRRTVLTALAIAAAIATLIGVVGIVDSFFVTIDRGEAAVLGDRPERLTVSLSGFALRGSAELERIAQTPGVGSVEPGLQVGGSLRTTHHKIETLLRLLPFDSRLWQPRLVSGHLDTTRPGIVIAQKAARDLRVDVGDTITLEHPKREGLGYRMVRSTIRVEGIHSIPYRFVSFMDTSDARLMNLDGIYNTVAVEPTRGASITGLQRNLFALTGVASVQPIRSYAQTIRDLLNQMLGVLRVIEAAVLLLALLIAFNSSAISVDERAREHATMFAFGVPLPRVVVNIVIESIVVGLLGTAAGLGFGHLIVRYITSILLPTTLPDLAISPAVSAATTVTAIVLGVVAVSLAPLLTIRRMRRMNIPATLRVVE